MYMTRSIIVCFVFATLLSCRQKFDSKTYQENKQSLASREQTHPNQFLAIDADNKKNFFGATVVKGTITNNASVCSYKQTRVKMLSFKNGIRMEEHEDVFPDLIKPGTSLKFKTRYHLPKGVDSISLSVMNAYPVLKDTLQFK